MPRLRAARCEFLMPEARAEPRLDALEQLLRSNARSYFPNLDTGEIRVELSNTDGGPLSTIHHFSFSGNGAQHDVVVKMPPNEDRQREGGARPGSTRPRVAPVLDQSSKFRNELETLRAIERQLLELDSGPLRSLTVLDFIDDLDAIVMEKRSEPTLKRLLKDNARFRPWVKRRDLDSAFRNTGAWLRAFHAIPDLAHTQRRLDTRDHFVESIARFCDFLSAQTKDSGFFDGLAERIGALAERNLSPELALGLGHGDLAPRNVLVAADSGVRVLDTRGAWRVPIYEDLAYFLVAVHTNRLQSYSMGMAFDKTMLARYCETFLTGYFGGDDVPRPAIRLFELQALLDKWSSQAEALESIIRRRSPFARYAHQASSGMLKRSISAALEALEAGSP
jgi:hypothetical protein